MRSLPLFLAVSAAFALPAAAQAPKPVLQNYEPRPALWLLADEDTKIYLFGTVHILPPGFKWRSAAVNRAVAEADELVVEDYQKPEEEEAAAGKMLAEMMLARPSPLLKRVPAAKRPALRAAITASSLPADAYDGLRTWAAAMMLAMDQLLGSYEVENADGAPGVEAVLETEFERAGKPISAIEDGDAVIRSFSAVPEPVQVKMLVDTAEATPTAVADSMMEDHRWARGEFENLAADLRRDLPPPVFELLVTRRNAEWTRWLTERLKQPGTLLVAVGAGHLAGDVSVQNMLARRGVKVVRVD